MDLGPYRFSPPWWGLLLFLIGVAIFCSLGVWQLERAEYKRGLAEAQRTARQAGLTEMTPTDAASSGNVRIADLPYGRRYSATGRFDAQRQILLSDQIHGPRAGYRVWTPLVLDNGIRVMVDRGWVPRPSSSEPLPNPEAPSALLRVTGFWRSFPQPPVQAGASPPCESRVWPRSLSYPDAAAVRCQYAAPVLSGLLLLDREHPNGFVRKWEDDVDIVGLPPSGHYMYAATWFAMALMAGVITVVVNLRKR